MYSLYFKMTVRSLLFIMIFVTSIHLGNGKKYDKYSLFTAYPTTGDHVNFLESLERNHFIDMSIWNKPIIPGKQIQIVVNHLHEKMFKEKTQHYKLAIKGLVENIQRVFDEQVVKQDVFNPFKNKWEFFHTLEDIYKNLNQTAQNYSDISTLEVIGKTAENRNILAFSVKHPIKHNNKVIMEAGAHGNEWIGTSFVMYFIEQLVNDEYSPLTEIKNMYNWYFIPVLNPDGYVYSQTKDRLWRKNRRRFTETAIGVDLNRNFDYKFGTYDSSNDPENDHYHGPWAFSEEETKALRDFVYRKRDGLMFYFSFHGYGQSFLIPFSDSVKYGGGNFYEMQFFAKQAASKIDSVTGRLYRVGNAFKVLGSKFSGDSASWVKTTFRAPYVYTILGRDDDYFGHAIPTNQILPFCTEMKVGLTELLKATPRYLKLGSIEDSAASVIVCDIIILCAVAFHVINY